MLEKLNYLFFKKLINLTTHNKNTYFIYYLIKILYIRA
jgi:hypothetical protein